MERVGPVVEMQGGNRRLGIDVWRGWDGSTRGGNCLRGAHTESTQRQQVYSGNYQRIGTTEAYQSGTGQWVQLGYIAALR